MRYVVAAASRLNEKIISGRAEKHLFFLPYYFICSVCVWTTATFIISDLQITLLLLLLSAHSSLLPYRD